MTHEEAFERLDDFASGELPDIERVRVQRHVDACDECRAEVAAIRELLAMAQALPAGIAPGRDLWAGIAGRLEPRHPVVEIVADEETRVIPLIPRRRPWQPPRWALQAAAAVVLVASSSAVTALVMRRQAPAAGPVAIAPVHVVGPAAVATPGEAVQGSAGGQTQATLASNPQTAEQGSAAPVPAGRQETAFAAFHPAEQQYQTAIDDLVRVLNARRGQLAPETVQTLDTNLRIIDQAIAESRAALEKDPNSRDLIQMLGATYDAKVKMLRQAVEL
jgi:anti-sigma factor RsiW